MLTRNLKLYHLINVEIQKEAMDKIIKSISNNFTVKTKLKEKFKMNYIDLRKYQH